MDTGTHEAVEKDVTKAVLSKEIKRLRKDGQAVYCLEYSKDVLDFEIWDFMFLTKYCCPNGLTMHRFETPPPIVLDLGCGTGLWTIEAAKQWKESKIVGFDFLNIQPRNVLPHDIIQRIEWKQGNFLDPLPFPSDHFDLIHVVRAGFHIPEDECIRTLKEAYRVLKPGGVIEIIEEDIIFPYARLPSPSRPDSRKYSVEIIDENLVFPSIDLVPPPIDTSVSQGSLDSPLSDAKSGLTRRSSQCWSITVEAASRRLTRSNDSILPKLPENKPPVNPRDHSQLKMAWDEMLRKRFLMSRCTTILEFHLQAHFTDVKTHPSLEIPMPGSSATRHDGAHVTPLSAHGRADTDKLFNLRPPSSRSSNDDNISIVNQRSRLLSSWAPMHLARTANTVIACKENVWEAYRELFGSQLSSAAINRASHAKDFTEVRPSPSTAVRDAFEKAWSNWDSDMKDRIGMRGRVRGELLWSEPANDAANWRVRGDCLRVPSNEQQTPPDDAGLCRNIQGFVGRKPDPLR